MGEQDTAQDLLDISAIMAEIRQRVRDDVSANKDTQKPFQGTPADFHATRKAGEIVNSEELRYLNRHYAYGPSLNLDSIKSHRPLIGKLIVKFKKKLMTLVWNLLKDYFTSEREYQANLVRFLNDFSKYVDARDAANFWELIRKLDVDINRLIERVERIADEQMGTLRSSESMLLDEIHASLNQLKQETEKIVGAANIQDTRLATLERVTSGFEAILARIGKTPNIPEASQDYNQDINPDFSYLLLENRSRGSEQEITERLKFYPALFSGAANPVLDIGQGRGELLKLFKETGIPAYGVDLDQAMVDCCNANGCKAFLGDALSHLRSLPSTSLGGIIGIQIVEHLTRKQLEELLTLCADKVEKGGKVIFETINPCSLLALSSNFYRDLTHIWPLHPDTLSYACEMAGLHVYEVRKLSPVPASACLQAIPIESYMTPIWAHTVELLNHNIKQLNDVVYGYQDYCVIAEA